MRANETQRRRAENTIAYINRVDTVAITVVPITNTNAARFYMHSQWTHRGHPGHQTTAAR